jgi:anti-sigma factor RsiW
MATVNDHIAERLSAYLGGDLAPRDAEEVRLHLASCAACSEELRLLDEGRAIAPPVAVEPRPWFAGRVAARAAELKPRPVGHPWWKWAFGGGAAVAAALAVAVVVQHGGGPDELPREDVLVAQRLDLYEDLNVVQNEEALEDLDVVEVLHTLQPEGMP